MYVVIVQIHVAPGSIDAFIAATKDNHLGTRKETGNLRFDLVRQLADPHRFTLYEVYVDEAAFAAHQVTPHYFQWRDTVAPMMAEPRSATRSMSVFPEPWG
jgi:autoinducer 2-degrading protein